MIVCRRKNHSINNLIFVYGYWEIICRCYVSTLCILLKLNSKKQENKNLK